jgi:hypothetical protein
MESTTMLMTGDMGYAGSARPRVGRSQFACVWSVAIAGPKPASADVNHTTTARRLRESSQ